MILIASVLLFILFSTEASQQPPRECDPAHFYPPVCDAATEECDVKIALNPATNKYECDKNNELQIKGTDTQAKWKKFDPFTCVNDGSGPKFNGNPIVGSINGMRCVRMSIDKLYKKTETECDPRKICNPASNCFDITCTAGYSLEIKSGGKWEGVSSAQCNSDKFTGILLNGIDIPHKPDGIRCIGGVNCNGYYDNSDCTAKEICKKPTFGSSSTDSISCDPDFTLQVKTGGKWEEVQQAVCNTGTFTATLATGSTLPSLPEAVRCVRMKCSLCDYPCPSPCVSTASYKKPSNLNECSKFTCGDHSRMKIKTVPVGNENLICEDKSSVGVSKWKKSVSGGTVDTKRDVECEILCTQKVPLTNICDANDYLCEKATLGDDGPVTCAATSKIVHKSSVDQKETEGSQLDCDKTRGVWKIKKGDGTVVDITQTGNVICKYEECNIAKFCPGCEKDAGSPNKYRCKPGHTVEIRDSPSSTPRSLPSTALFVCKLGRWVNEAGASLVESTTVNCIPITTTPLPVTPPTLPKDTTDSDASSSEVGMGAGSYVVIVLALLIFAIGIIVAAFKLSGKGWLHTIILSKLRKGKKKDAKSKAGTPKDAGSHRVSSKTQWPAASPRVDSSKAKAADADQEEEEVDAFGDGNTETTGGLTGGETETVTVTEGVQTTFDV